MWCRSSHAGRRGGGANQTYIYRSRFLHHPKSQRQSFRTGLSGLIIRNEAGKVNIHRITYDLNGQQAKQLPFDLYRDGYEYYLQTHAHPGSTFRYTKSSLVDLMAFDASERMHLTNQPLLMMAGSIADTFYMTEQCFSKATGTNDKELFLIPEATHIQTYWVPEYGDKAVGKLTKFFEKYLYNDATHGMYIVRENDKSRKLIK